MFQLSCYNIYVPHYYLGNDCAGEGQQQFNRLTNWTIGRILFIFGILEFARHKSMASEDQHSSSKNRGFSQPPKHKIAIFSKTILKILIIFQQLMKTISLNKSA
jgi:hypothetical protein